MLSLGNRFREYRPEDEVVQLRDTLQVVTDHYEALDRRHCQQASFWFGIAMVEFVMLMIIAVTRSS